MIPETVALLNLFGTRLPAPLTFTLTDQGHLDLTHPLAGEIQAVLEGRPASLPYPSGSGLMWATIAPTASDLRRTIDDLRCWILPSFGWEASPSIVSTSSGGAIGDGLLTLSPSGYFRWQSRSSDTGLVMQRLAKLREVVAKVPVRDVRIRLNIEALRRRFAVALATGDYDAALNAVDEIDHRQLDTASNALSMRIRLLARFGDDQAIVNHPQLDDLLSTRVARRVAENVLIAHHSVYIAALEDWGDATVALAAYLPLHDRLAGLADDITVDTDIVVGRMAAYDAAASNDGQRIRRLAEVFPADEIIGALARPYAGDPASIVALEDSAQVSPPVEAGPDGPDRVIEVLEPAQELGWSDVPALIAEDEKGRLGAFLQQAMQTPDILDPGDGDFLIELFTDAAITADSAKSVQADRVLTAVIDAYICEDRFPRRERLTFYQALLEVLYASREASSDGKDSQLLITLGEALLRLDGRFEPSVATAFGGWWAARPVRSRLTWLSEAIDLLTEQSIDKQYLALWYAGAALLKLDAHDQTFEDLQLWHRLGRRLGLEPAVAAEALGGLLQEPGAAEDPLVLAGYGKIAVVSLQERPAMEAAAQIRARTDADVIVVVEHAAGEATASAATADVILFVWGANKHAVYRAFDKVRDRLEYVRGTGSASIVRALVRRARGTL